MNSPCLFFVVLFMNAVYNEVNAAHSDTYSVYSRKHQNACAWITNDTLPPSIGSIIGIRSELSLHHFCASVCIDYGQPTKNSLTYGSLLTEQIILQGIKLSVLLTIAIEGIDIAIGINSKISIKHSLTRKISRLTGKIASISIPSYFRKALLAWYINKYKVNINEIDGPLSQYKSFQQLFTRNIKKELRPILDYNNCSIISPVDAQVLILGDVKNRKIECVKGITYTVDELLTGNYDTQIDTSNLKYVVLYLSPGDYHHYHCPINGIFNERIYIPRYLEPVRPSYVMKHQNVFKTNERVSLLGSWNSLFFSMVLVGALNVSSIKLHFDRDFLCNEAKNKCYSSERKLYTMDKKMQINEVKQTGHISKLAMQCKKEQEFVIKVGQKVKVGETIFK